MNKGMIINSFAFDMIDELDPDEKAALLTAMSAFYRGEEIPELSKPAKMAFKRISADNAKFNADHKEEISKLRSEIGKKGAEARWQTMANDGKNSKNAKNKNKDKEKNKNKELSVYTDGKSDAYEQRRERIKELMGGQEMNYGNILKAIKEAQ